CTQRQSGSVEYKAAANLLNLISEARNLVLARMLADACDECIVLTRFLTRKPSRWMTWLNKLKLSGNPLALCRARVLEHWLHTFGCDSSAQREVGAYPWKKHCLV
ncbi:MAG: hypothetical protein ACKPKO_55745, partial [Candidatus Fonsibacter sp.]